MTPPKGEDVLVASGRLVRSVLAVDRNARVQTLHRIVSSMPVVEVIPLLELILERAAEADRRSLMTLTVVTRYFASLGDTDEATALYAAARDQRADRVARLLMRPGPAKTFDPREEKGIDREMRAKSLGHRRAMARVADPVTLERLVTDPDPGVIRNLLQHPRLTELQVVRIAARRPGRPEVLRELYLSPRWTVRRAVQKALANNPYTPTDIALKIIPLLPLPDVRELARDGNLHAEVRRSAASRLVEARRRQDVARQSANLADLDPAGDA